MSDILATLETQTGLNAGLVKNAVGAVMKFLKDHLPADLFGKVEAAIPQADEALTSFLSNAKEPGLLGAVGSKIGELLGGGGGDLAKLLESLSRAGLSLDQAKAFLPRLLEALKAHLPADLFQKLVQALPALGSALEQPAH